MKRIKAAVQEEPAVKKNTRPQAFQKGRPKTGGRQKGTPNKVSRDLQECIVNAMEMLGSDRKGRDGASGYLMTIAQKRPSLFLSLVERMLPLQITGKDNGPVQLEYRSKEDIVLRFKERGLPPPPSLLAPPQEVLDAEYEEVGEYDEQE